MTNSFKRIVCFLLLSSMAFAATADEWWRFWSEDSVTQQVKVAQPYIDLRSGPAQGFPVILSSEKGEWLTLLKRKTDWMKVADHKGREGWVAIEDLLLTEDATGQPVAITEPRFDDFRTRRWESGLQMGEFDSTAVNSAYIGYWMTDNLSAELSGSQILGNSSEIQMFSASLVHQLFPRWRYSPFFRIGGGQIKIKPKATLLSVDNSKNSIAHAGIGMRCYVSDRFFVRLEVNDYKVFTNEDSNEEATEWKLGLSVFF
jgi:hypothetical protein